MRCMKMTELHDNQYQYEEIKTLEQKYIPNRNGIFSI